MVTYVLSLLLLATIMGFLCALPSILATNIGFAIFEFSLMAALIFMFGCLGAVPTWNLTMHTGDFIFLSGIIWVIVLSLSILINNDSYDKRYSSMVWAHLAGLFGLAMMFAVNILNFSPFANTEKFSALLGKVESRVWTTDVQPKDPKHIRLVTHEMANYLADKCLGEMPGAVGSQFKISEAHMTLQMINKELWYVVPLDYRGLFVWMNSPGSPGYIMVHAEDPRRTPVPKITKETLCYMPGAYFSACLPIHLYLNGYTMTTDYSFEVDDNGSPWWVATVYKPVAGWFGKEVTGITIVNPTSGKVEFFLPDKVPAWVDRVFPSEVVEQYIAWRGAYANGFWNSVLAQKDITRPETPTIIYASDGTPEWVTCVTAASKDNSMIGVYYTATRTGVSRFYRAAGSTEEGVLASVQAAVGFKKWHGSDPALYNIYGVMSSVVPLLGDNHAFQGVAIVRVDNQRVVWGEDEMTAFREFQKSLMESGQQVAPEMASKHATYRGMVSRVAFEIQGGNTIPYLQLDTHPTHLFTGKPRANPALWVTKQGDYVIVTAFDSGEDVLTMITFENESIPLARTKAQEDVAERVSVRQAEMVVHEAVKTVRERVKVMTDEELEALLKLREQGSIEKTHQTSN